MSQLQPAAALFKSSAEVESCMLVLQELERQEDARHGSPSHTTAAMTTIDTVTQGSSGHAAGSPMITDADVGRCGGKQVHVCIHLHRHL